MTQIDWHSGFDGGFHLSLRKYKDVLSIERQHYITQEPTEIDELVIKKKPGVVVQVVVIKELKDPEFLPLRIMVRDANEDEIKEFLREALTYEIPEDQNNASAVLNISSEANEDTFIRLRSDVDMGDAMRRVMKDDLAESERRGEQSALVQSIINLMNNMKWTIEQAMDALSIPSDQRSMYAGMVNKQ